MRQARARRSWLRLLPRVPDLTRWKPQKTVSLVGFGVGAALMLTLVFMWSAAREQARKPELVATRAVELANTVTSVPTHSGMNLNSYLLATRDTREEKNLIPPESWNEQVSSWKSGNAPHSEMPFLTLKNQERPSLFLANLTLKD